MRVEWPGDLGAVRDLDVRKSLFAVAGPDLTLHLDLAL